MHKIIQHFLHIFYYFCVNQYYEHVIRNESELNKIREYIINNPLQWELDIENPDRTKEYKDLTNYFKEKIKQ